MMTGSQCIIDQTESSKPRLLVGGGWNCVCDNELMEFINKSCVLLTGLQNHMATSDIQIAFINDAYSIADYEYVFALYL